MADKTYIMDQAEETLGRVSEKLNQLVKRYQALEKENEKYRRELEMIRQQHESLMSEVQQWKQQADILKFSRGVMSEDEKKAFEKRLNQYVREIDRCISMLGT